MTDVTDVYVLLDDVTEADVAHGTVWLIGRAWDLSRRGHPYRWIAADPPRIGQRIRIGEHVTHD